MLLAELVPLSNQAQYKNGAILAGGLLKIFYKGRTEYATTYSDAAGNVENPNPVILDNEGRCSVYASPDYSYTLVFCDKYGQVQFSYDKDLLDPIPVEDTYSIAIKGDETITVNKQLSGQTEVYNLHAKGEGYNGIDPIVVDNVHRNISANHVQLGVVAPLEFVEDSESATVIGFNESAFSAIIEPMVESATSGKLDESAFNEFTATADVIKYSAGPNIEIQGHEVSGKDWLGEIEAATSGKLDTSSFDSYSADVASALDDKQDKITWEYTTGGFISGADGSAFNALTEISANGQYMSANGNEVGLTDDAENAISEVSGKLDTSAFSSVSGELGFYSEYHRTGYVLSGNLTIDKESPSDNLVVKISGKDNGGTPSSMNVGLILPFGGSTPVLRHAAMSSGGKVFWDGTEYASVDTVSAMIDSATSSYDMSAGANINIVKDDVNSAIGIEVTGLSAYQPVGEYYSASNPSGFITNDAITGLQPSGDYVVHDELSAYQSAGDYYSASNPSGFITAVPEGTLNESGFEYDSDNLISGYNGSAFAGQGGGGGADYSGISPVIVDNSAREISVESYGLVAGNNISITDDSVTSSTTIAVTGLNNYASTSWVQNNYYDINDVDSRLGNKQDTLTFNYTNNNKISGINNSALDTAGSDALDLVVENGISAVEESGTVRLGNTYNLTAYSGTNVLQLTDDLGLLGGVISSVNYEKEIPGSAISSTEWACSSEYWRDQAYEHVDLVDSSFVNNPASSYDIDFYTVFRWDAETANFGVDLYDITNDSAILQLTPLFDEPNIRYHFTATNVTSINTANNIGYRIYNYSHPGMWEAWAQGPNNGDWNPTSATITGYGDPSTAICAISGLTWTGGGASYSGDVQGALDEVYNNSANYLKDTDLDIKTFEGIVSGVNAISGEQILPSALAPNTIQLSTGNGGSEFRYMPTASPWTTADAATGIFRPLMYATGACLTMSSGPFFKGYFKGNEWFVSNTDIGQAVRGEVQAARGARIWGAEVTGHTSAEFILSAKAGDAGLYLSNPTTSVEFGINSIVNIQTNSATWNEASAVSSKQDSLTFTYVEI